MLFTNWKNWKPLQAHPIALSWYSPTCISSVTVGTVKRCECEIKNTTVRARLSRSTFPTPSVISSSSFTSSSWADGGTCSDSYHPSKFSVSLSCPSLSHKATEPILSSSPKAEDPFCVHLQREPWMRWIVCSSFLHSGALRLITLSFSLNPLLFVKIFFDFFSGETFEMPMHKSWNFLFLCRKTTIPLTHTNRKNIPPQNIPFLLSLSLSPSLLAAAMRVFVTSSSLLLTHFYGSWAAVYGTQNLFLKS